MNLITFCDYCVYILGKSNAMLLIKLGCCDAVNEKERSQQQQNTIVSHICDCFLNFIDFC